MRTLSPLIPLYISPIPVHLSYISTEWIRTGSNSTQAYQFLHCSLRYGFWFCQQMSVNQAYLPVIVAEPTRWIFFMNPLQSWINWARIPHSSHNWSMNCPIIIIQQYILLNTPLSWQIILVITRNFLTPWVGTN